MPNIFKRHFAGIVTLVLIIAGVGGIVSSYKKATMEQRAREAVRISGEIPQALLNETEFDWGEIDRNTIVEQSFTLSNPSNAPLEITLIVTSCGCTTAELLLEGSPVELPAAIPPGGEGIVRVAFDPASMDVRGDAKRAVRIETNDPENPFLIINLYAHVR